MEYNPQPLKELVVRYDHMKTRKDATLEALKHHTPETLGVMVYKTRASNCPSSKAYKVAKELNWKGYKAYNAGTQWSLIVKTE